MLTKRKLTIFVLVWGFFSFKYTAHIIIATVQMRKIPIYLIRFKSRDVPVLIIQKNLALLWKPQIKDL